MFGVVLPIEPSEVRIGDELQVTTTAGDLVELEVRGSRVTLRRSEADQLAIEDAV